MKCKDCGSTTRDLKQVGTRTFLCTTCIRARKKNSKLSARAKHLWDNFKMTLEEYEALYEMQGGKCWLCMIATGTTKALSVDHDHRCCTTVPTCGKCTRGLLCGECNQFISRRMSDDPIKAQRFVDYLLNPPATSFLKDMRCRVYLSLHPGGCGEECECRP